MPLEDGVVGLQAQVTAVLAPQLPLDAPRAEVALPPQLQDSGFFLLEDLAPQAGLRSAALRDEAGFALLRVPAQPLPQRRHAKPAACVSSYSRIYVGRRLASSRM
jgi:hypothetical protein